MKILEPVQFDFATSSEFQGKWFVPVEMGRYETHYVHQDGKIREGTRDPVTDKYTGYFDTEKEAIQAALFAKFMMDGVLDLSTGVH